MVPNNLSTADRSCRLLPFLTRAACYELLTAAICRLVGHDKEDTLLWGRFSSDDRCEGGKIPLRPPQIAALRSSLDIDEEPVGRPLPKNLES